VNRNEEAWIQTPQTVLLSPQALAPKKALEAVWLWGLSAPPAVGCANHLLPGFIGEIDRLV